MTGALLINRLRRLTRDIRATRDLAFIVLAPGGVLCAVAWLKWKRENR